MNPRRALLTLLLMVVAWPCFAQGGVPFRLGVHPYLPVPLVQKRFAPLAKYLSRVLEREVVLSIAPDYRSHIMRIAAGELDIAYMGPAPYVKLVDEFGSFPLIARQAVLGKPVFNGVIIARGDGPVATLEDLRGKRFAFGDPSSTMSHLLPLYVLLQAGISQKDLGGYGFVGDHQSVALAVLRGGYDAGGVKQEVYARFRHRGLTLLTTTPSISEHLFVARKDMPEAEVGELHEVFFGMDDSESGRAALQAIKPTVTAMVPVVDSDYDSLRAIIDTLRAAGDSL